MFDLNDENTTKSVKDNAWDRMSDDALNDTQETPEHELDSPENDELYRKLTSYYQQELDRQYLNRLEMAIDEDFYDHIQWTEAEQAELAERGQAPTVYNVIAQTCNWIMGSEKRGRVDYKVLPRRKEDGTSAERKTQLLKYLSDVNKTPFHRSRAFEDTVKVGIGWVENGVQDSDDGEPIYDRYEGWRNVLWDSSATSMDLEDGRYQFRTKWVDVDIAEALAPERKEIIMLAKEDGIRFGYDGQYADEVMDQHEMELDFSGSGRAIDANYRERVRLIECWFRMPEKVNKIIEGDWRGDIYDEDSPHPALQKYVEEAQAQGRQVIAERVAMRMYCAIFTTKGLLYLGPSPYRHNKFPLTPIWGYRRGRDGMPYGVIRGLRDMQSDINKRMSKTLYILSTNKTVMDEGAVEDVDEYRKEVAKPNAIIVKRPGKALDLNVDRDLADSHLELMSRNIAMIQQVGGVTDELMGRTTNATSGVAIQSRQEQGSLATSKLFDNLRYAFNDHGAKQLSLIEQFMTEERQFRITNQRGTPEFVTVNDGLPENDIVSQKADFIISEDEWRATMRQSQADQLMEMMARMQPEVSLVLLDLVIEIMDLPNKDEMVQRIRQLNGMSDPDADPESPEEIAKAEQKAAQAQQQQAMVEAQLRGLLAKAGKDEAAIAESQSKIQKAASSIAKENVETQGAAIEAAINAILNSAAIPVADGMLHEAGFNSRTEQEEIAQAQAIQQAEAQQVAQQQEAAAAQGGGMPPETMPSGM